jgi:hypothetical protein
MRVQRTGFSVDCITTTCESEFLAHTTNKSIDAIPLA